MPQANKRSDQTCSPTANNTHPPSNHHRSDLSSALVAPAPSRIQTGSRLSRFISAPIQASPAQSDCSVFHQSTKQARQANPPANGPAKLTAARVRKEIPSAFHLTYAPKNGTNTGSSTGNPLLFMSM